MANISSAPYPRLNALLTIAAKQTENWHHLSGSTIAVCDGWLCDGFGFYIADSVRHAMLGYVYLVNNNDAYGSVMQSLCVPTNNLPYSDLIIGRKDWLEINREILSLPPAWTYLVMI